MTIVCWHWLVTESRIERVIYERDNTANEAAQHLPAGVYTTLRTYGRSKILCFDEHMERIEQSAELSGYRICLNKNGLREIMRIATYETKIPNEIKFRIHIDLTQSLGDIYLIPEPLSLPTMLEINQGATAMTRRLFRDNPQAKSTGFISTAEALRKEMPPGVNEILMVDGEGAILEGLSSNFFAIKDNSIWTAREGVLPGITQKLVFNAIKHMEIMIHNTAYPENQIALLTEAFLTSTSRGVLPLTVIDSNTIGNGHPGEITLRIRDEYERQVNEEIEAI